MKKNKKIIAILLCSFAIAFLFAQNTNAGLPGSLATSKLTNGSDPVAENMLLYQRANGGWPKHFKTRTIDYTHILTEAELQELQAGYTEGIDATIDNNATNKEIRYLAGAFKKTKDNRFLAAVEKGIAYLLKAQYNNGGWPQYYPDFSGYRGEITYNDNAMVNVLNVLQDVTEGSNDLDIVAAAYKIKCAQAVQRGISCIVKTQVKQKGILTGWCAQYDATTLLPAKARAYELPSLSGQESVGILRFLMRFNEPSSDEIKAVVKAGVEWLDRVKIVGFKVTEIDAPGTAKGKDRVLLPEPGNIMWARFMELDTNEPFFCGRDGIKKKTLAEVEYERRNGYSWYNNTPLKLINQEYPKWAAKWKVNDIKQ